MDLSIQYKKPESDITWDTNTNIVSSQVVSSQNASSQIVNSQIENLQIVNNVKKIDVISNFNDMFERIFILNKLDDYDNWYNIINTINQKSINIRYYSRHPIISEKNEIILKQYSNHQKK